MSLNAIDEYRGIQLEFGRKAQKSLEVLALEVEGGNVREIIQSTFITDRARLPVARLLEKPARNPFRTMHCMAKIRSTRSRVWTLEFALRQLQIQ